MFPLVQLNWMRSAELNHGWLEIEPYHATQLENKFCFQAIYELQYYIVIFCWIDAAFGYSEFTQFPFFFLWNGKNAKRSDFSHGLSSMNENKIWKKKTAPAELFECWCNFDRSTDSAVESNSCVDVDDFFQK